MQVLGLCLCGAVWACLTAVNGAGWCFGISVCDRPHGWGEPGKKQWDMRPGMWQGLGAGSRPPSPCPGVMTYHAVKVKGRPGGSGEELPRAACPLGPCLLSTQSAPFPSSAWSFPVAPGESSSTPLPDEGFVPGLAGFQQFLLPLSLKVAICKLWCLGSWRGLQLCSLND